MSTSMQSTAELRRELRSSMDDRNKLSTLHSIITDSINRSYGEEKAELIKFRQEVKNALNCRVPGKW